MRYLRCIYNCCSCKLPLTQSRRNLCGIRSAAAPPWKMNAVVAETAGSRLLSAFHAANRSFVRGKRSDRPGAQVRKQACS